MNKLFIIILLTLKNFIIRFLLLLIDTLETNEIKTNEFLFFQIISKLSTYNATTRGDQKVVKMR